MKSLCTRAALQKVAACLFCLTLGLQFSVAQQLPAQLRWQLKSQSSESASPAQLSRPGYHSSGWIDAVVPGTVFYSYVKAGKESNPDYAENIYNVNKTQYNQPYWYRTEFPAVGTTQNHIWLKFNGIHKRAEIYFNGHHLGTIRGLMARGIYDVTPFIGFGTANAIAVLVVPPRNDPEHNHPLANWESPTYIPSASWDWMPAVPGLNSGITDTVALSSTGPVSIQDPWVHSELPSHRLAKLTVSAHLQNTGASPVTGVLRAVITPGNIVITGKPVTLQPNAGTTVTYRPDDFKQLNLKNPALWWPNGYGGKADGTQHLYTCRVEFKVNGAAVSDQMTKSFGIRKITSDTTSLNGPMRLYVNDVPVLLKGGNWGMSDYMLKARGKDYETRIRFHKEMNYNMIRNWTGEVTDEAFYRYCDKYGIMVWDDFWLNNFGQVDSVEMFRQNAVEKIKKFRNHPSIVIWCGANEGVPGGSPNSALSNAIISSIRENDGEGDRLYLPRSNAGVNNPNFSIHGGSRILSGSGIWGNVDPKTYFTDPHNGYLFSKDNYGMRSELGAAAFVNIESFKKFMPKEYWVAPTTAAVDSKTNMWARHYFSTDGALGGGSQPVRYINDINHSYGTATSIEDFCKKAQLMNVETMKAMYEAWNDHLWNNASGMLIWMSQSAYPTMIWQTYDYYYDLTGAYFGAKTACEPVHIQWNAATNSVKVINNRPYALHGLVAQAQVYNMDGKPVAGYNQKQTVNVDATSAKEAFIALRQTAGQAKLTDVYFLKLKLFDAGGKLLSENFYWLGKRYLDYTALNQLPATGAALKVSRPAVTKALNGVNQVLTYTVTNTSGTAAAFGIRAQLLDRQGAQILPAIFNDGYFALMQGESKVLSVEVDPSLLKKGYRLDVKPYNN